MKRSRQAELDEMVARTEACECCQGLIRGEWHRCELCGALAVGAAFLVGERGDMSHFHLCRKCADTVPGLEG
jgi:hypothetical protein